MRWLPQGKHPSAGLLLLPLDGIAVEVLPRLGHLIILLSSSSSSLRSCRLRRTSLTLRMMPDVMSLVETNDASPTFSVRPRAGDFFSPEHVERSTPSHSPACIPWEKSLIESVSVSPHSRGETLTDVDRLFSHELQAELWLGADGSRSSARRSVRLAAPEEKPARRYPMRKSTQHPTSSGG